MENKYYTPEIEEFHVGFEYERYNKDYEFNDGWYPCNQPPLLLSPRYNCVSMEEATIRVKYLDREDIESEGWEYVPFIHPGEMAERWYDMFKKGQYEFTGPVVADNNICYIRYKGHIVFKGHIKNKSELKTLLKQLGI